MNGSIFTKIEKKMKHYNDVSHPLLLRRNPHEKNIILICDLSNYMNCGHIQLLETAELRGLHWLGACAQTHNIRGAYSLNPPVGALTSPLPPSVTATSVYSNVLLYIVYSNILCTNSVPSKCHEFIILVLPCHLYYPKIRSGRRKFCRLFRILSYEVSIAYPLH